MTERQKVLFCFVIVFFLVGLDFFMVGGGGGGAKSII